MAPVEKATEKIPQQTIIEKTLGRILPQAFADSINQHKIKPAIYPKFEIIKSEPETDWQIRAVTCEFPEIDLRDYKNEIAGSLKATKIWKPSEGKTDESHSTEASQEEKEQMVIKTLLEKIKVDIPKILIEEEVNNRLANLLARIEKLGLSLETYLASIGKTPETLRAEYEIQSKNTITLDLILEKVTETENIKIEDKQVEETIKAYQADPKTYEKINTPEQKKVIVSILRRRAALEFLTHLG
jgi:FKBP-type peptidyl-prolyl cis-trans isomerase (trigger factor)